MVGTLSTKRGASSYTYTLVAGTGDTDNSRFNISGTNLRLTVSADYETQATYSVRVNANDGTNDFAKQFTISISDVNDAPTARRCYLFGSRK